VIKPTLVAALLAAGALPTAMRADTPASPVDKVLNLSGTYPHLTVFSGSGECGIGAVAAWAGKLWFLTYPPHQPEGSDDKLYSVDADLKLSVHPASVGGTHAGRMVHRESDQLILGPYFIDRTGNVRAADVHQLRARLTAVTRHLIDPANQVYFFGMHGMFYDFPKSFSASNTAGLRPISTYLKMPVDYCWWGGRIVMARDDASIMQNELAGQSHSALWFGQVEDLKRYGPPSGWGGPWLDDDVKASQPSEPFLVAGFERGVLHLRQRGDGDAIFIVQADLAGGGRWTPLAAIRIPPRGYALWTWGPERKAAWLRVTSDRDVPGVTACFHVSNPAGPPDPAMFRSLAEASSQGPVCDGLVKPAQGDARTLLFAANVEEGGKVGQTGFYQVDGRLELGRTDDPVREKVLRSKYGVGGPDFVVGSSSVIVGQGKERFLLPKGPAAYDAPFGSGWPRGKREVVTERFLFNAHGTFYELPRADAGGIRGIRPVATHHKRISDFCSWRGLLVLAGTRSDAEPDGHFFRSNDGKAGLWLGNVDDLWRLGKPRGTGGPWHDTPVAANAPCDPYLMTGYDKKTLRLTHDSPDPVRFTVEVDFLADGTWSAYDRLSVRPGEALVHRFPDGYSARWVRLSADKPCRATAEFTYE